MEKHFNDMRAYTPRDTPRAGSPLSPFWANVTGFKDIGSSFKQSSPGAMPVPWGSEHKRVCTGEIRYSDLHHSQKAASRRQQQEKDRVRIAAARALKTPTQAHHFEKLGLPVPAKYLVGRDPNTLPAIPLTPLPPLSVSDGGPSISVPTKILVAADSTDPAKHVKHIEKVKSTLASDTVRLIKPAPPAFKNFEMVSLTHIIETQFQHLATVQEMDMRARRLAAITEAHGMLNLKRQIEELSPITVMDIKKTLRGIFVGNKHEHNAEYVERLADLLIKKQENDWEVVVRKLERFKEFWGLYKRVFAEKDEEGNLHDEEIYILGAKGKKSDFVRCVKQSGITGAPRSTAPSLPTSLEKEASHSSSSSDESALHRMVGGSIEQRVWPDCGL